MNTTDTEATQSQNYRVTFKLIILGNSSALQAGYLNQIVHENMSCHLFSTLGLSIGVTTIDYDTNTSATLQFWSIPVIERYPGLTKSFLRGHSGAVIVVESEELNSIEDLFTLLTADSRKACVIVIVGEVSDVESVRTYISDTFQSDVEYIETDRAIDTTSPLLERLMNRNRPASISIVNIPEGDCPPFEMHDIRRAQPLNTKQEIKLIRDLADSLYIPTTSSKCFIPLNTGVAEVDFASGCVTFEPILCDFCQRDCKRKANICIVGVDEGWSSEKVPLGRRALLTMAKIYGLNENEIPTHVEKQLLHATQCSNYLAEHDIPEFLKDIGLRIHNRSSLLEMAQSRFDEGKLSQEAFEMLKKRIHANNT